MTVGDILPIPVSLNADGTSLTVTFNAPLDTSSTPDASAFAVGVSSGTAPSVSSVSIAGNTLTLTLGTAVAAEQRLTLQYTKPGGDDDVVLQDDDGNEVASFKLRVQNVTTDSTAPTVASASVSGATLTVVFSEAMDADSIPAAGAFAVDVSGTTDDPAVTSITLYEDTATLTLSAVIKAGKTAKLTYTKPTGANAKPLRDLAGNDLASIPSATAKTVVNGTFESIVLNKTSLEVAEGGTGTFDVELSAQPPKDVTVRLSLDTDGVAELDTRELTFTTGDWDTAQTVTVTGAYDANDRDDAANVALFSELSDGTGLRRRDERTLALNVTDTSGHNALEFTPDGLTITEGSSGTLSVRLTAQPNADVHVTTIRPESADGLSVSPATLVFTASDYATEQSFTLHADEDADADDEDFGITLEAIGGGYDYRTATITVRTIDTGAAKALAAEPKTLLTVDEGGSATATLKLSAAPTGDVTVSVALGTTPAHRLTVSPPSLTFTTSDYGNPQTLTFSSGADDNTDDESIVATLTASGGGYDNKSLRLEVVSRDDDLKDHEQAPTVELEALDSGGAAVAAEARIPSNGKIKVSFSKAVGTCSRLTDEVCPTAVTAWTSLTSAEKGRLFELVRVGFLDAGETREIPFTVTVSGNDVTLTPTGLNGTDYEDEPKRIRLLVRDKYWSVDGGVRGASKMMTWRVDAPALSLSVSDATVTEAANAKLAFTVSLDRAVKPVDGTVSVAYATSDVTATAGADYTATSGTLTFAVGETRKTVNVTVLDDAVDDGGETLTLTLSNAVGAGIADGTGTGTINNSDPMPKAWLGRFGRSVAEQVLDGVRERQEAIRTPGEQTTIIGGYEVPLFGSSASLDGEEDAAELLRKDPLAGGPGWRHLRSERRLQRWQRLELVRRRCNGCQWRFGIRQRPKRQFRQPARR